MSVKLKIKKVLRRRNLSTLSFSPGYSPFKGVGGGVCFGDSVPRSPIWGDGMFYRFSNVLFLYIAN